MARKSHHGNLVLSHRLSKTFTWFMFMEIIIKRQALLSALAGAKAAYPNEFICLLTGEREDGADNTTNIVIDGTIIPPGISVSRGASMFDDWMMPLLDGVVGSFHSHPNGNILPSRQDLRLFSKKGGINFIAAAPYGMKDVACYFSNSKKAEFKVAD